MYPSGDLVVKEILVLSKLAFCKLSAALFFCKGVGNHCFKDSGIYFKGLI